MLSGSYFNISSLKILIAIAMNFYEKKFQYHKTPKRTIICESTVYLFFS